MSLCTITYVRLADGLEGQKRSPVRHTIFVSVRNLQSEGHAAMHGFINLIDIRASMVTVERPVRLAVLNQKSGVKYAL